MKAILTSLLNQTTATYSDQQCAWLVTHIGDLDSDIRDQLVFNSFCHGFLDHCFTNEQMRRIANDVTTKQLLFCGITGQNEDDIYTRTFTALLGSLMLHVDKENAFLSDFERQTWLAWSITYLNTEDDWRGFTQEHGWAHGIAHGSDLLTEAATHPSFSSIQLKQALDTVKNVLYKQTSPFLDDEEERLARVILAVSSNRKSDRHHTLNFIKQLNDELWSQYHTLDANNAAYYRLSAWKRILMTLYFNDTTFQVAIKPMITQYFAEMGML